MGLWHLGNPKHTPPSSRCPQLTLFTDSREVLTDEEPAPHMAFKAFHRLVHRSFLISCFSPQLSKPWRFRTNQPVISWKGHDSCLRHLLTLTTYQNRSSAPSSLSLPPPLVMEHLLLFAFCLCMVLWLVFSAPIHGEGIHTLFFPLSF